VEGEVVRTAQDYELRSAYDPGTDYGPERGVGWLTFAAVMLGLAGIWNFIDGILAISKSHVYTSSSQYIFSDLKTWGWIVMVLGVLEVAAAGAIFSSRAWARWFGIGAASLNAIGQLAFVPAYPVWALAMFAVDVVIIYALAVYGGRQAEPAI
jgi:hypothetical protein